MRTVKELAASFVSDDQREFLAGLGASLFSYGALGVCICLLLVSVSTLFASIVLLLLGLRVQDLVTILRGILLALVSVSIGAMATGAALMIIT